MLPEDSNPQLIFIDNFADPEKPEYVVSEKKKSAKKSRTKDESDKLKFFYLFYGKIILFFFIKI